MTPTKFISLADTIAARGGLQTRFDAARAFIALTLAAIVLLVICLGLMTFDPRQIGAELTWTKPTKFAVSFAVLFLTQALVLRQLSAHWRFNLIMVLDGRCLRRRHGL